MGQHLMVFIPAIYNVCLNLKRVVLLVQFVINLALRVIVGVHIYGCFDTKACQLERPLQP